MTYYTYYLSPIGRLFLISDGSALSGLYLDTQLCLRDLGIRNDALPVFRQTAVWLDRYFAGEMPSPHGLLLALYGTAFQQKVWKILLDIPYGETRTYGDIAREISPVMSPQAVGGAVGRNPVSIIIPCHRVVGTGGALTGYAGGLQNKKWLLRHEEETKHDHQ